MSFTRISNGFTCPCCSSNVPFLTTLHGRLDLPGLDQVCGGFRRAFVSISDNQRLPLAGVALARARSITDCRERLLKPSYERGSYLAFLGRLSPEKGPDVAIRIAMQANMQLRIAAKLPRGQTPLFQGAVAAADRCLAH